MIFKKITADVKRREKKMLLMKILKWFCSTFMVQVTPLDMNFRIYLCKKKKISLCYVFAFSVEFNLVSVPWLVQFPWSLPVYITSIFLCPTLTPASWNFTLKIFAICIKIFCLKWNWGFSDKYFLLSSVDINLVGFDGGNIIYIFDKSFFFFFFQFIVTDNSWVLVSTRLWNY